MLAERQRRDDRLYICLTAARGELLGFLGSALFLLHSGVPAFAEIRLFAETHLRCKVSYRLPCLKGQDAFLRKISTLR